MRLASVFVDVDGLRVHSYASGHGNGLPVVLIHGWASSGRMWASTMREALSEYRCFALDLPGHGRSDKPPKEWYSVPAFGHALAGFAQRVGVESPAIIGHSMGATIALQVVSSQSMAVRSLVLVNPVISGRVGLLQWWPEPPEAGPLWRVARRMWPVVTRVAQQISGRTFGLLPEYVIRNQADLASTTADSAMGSLHAVAMADIRPSLPAIRIPALVVIGDQDHVVPPMEGIQAARILPQAKLVRLPCGHHPHDEAPTAYQEALRTFLEQAA